SPFVTDPAKRSSVIGTIDFADEIDAAAATTDPAPADGPVPGSGPDPATGPGTVGRGGLGREGAGVR
ncbi:hypothetical protein, partial [Streptomyces sp. NPDC097619]|uniref:hypothetical protein n=1 Tax=Streptomyces sp. NPDC097619 TaxID=3157228 RepID=UPI0033339F93